MLYAILLLSVFLLGMVYLAYTRRHQNPRMYQGVKTFAVSTAALSIVVLGSLPSYASLDLVLDMQPLFDSISDFVGVFLPVFAIGGGIAIAVALVSMIINQIVAAVKRGG